MSLTTDELRHYSRHLLLEEVGRDGQEKLKSAKVLLIGAGGLGCPAALYLAAAGVGTMGIIDFDTVDVSNLQRQIAFSYDDVGKSKAESIEARLKASNPHINLKIYNERFSIDNARTLFEEYDVIVDGCDNFGTRYLSNDASYFAGKPLIFGAIHRFQGQMSVFNGSEDAPCYRCLFPNPPEAGTIPNCAEAGVLGVLPGVVGGIQATEAIKNILGIGSSLQGYGTCQGRDLGLVGIVQLLAVGSNFLQQSQGDQCFTAGLVVVHLVGTAAGTGGFGFELNMSAAHHVTVIFLGQLPTLQTTAALTCA